MLADLHAKNVKVITHIVPWQRDRLPTLHGTIPARPGDELDAGHIQNYWQQHVALVNAGVDAWWPDEGDWFNLFERIKRHQLYYQGPALDAAERAALEPAPQRPPGRRAVGWLGLVGRHAIDLEDARRPDRRRHQPLAQPQPVLGLRHRRLLHHGELTGELYARWFQFAAFCPSFRSHGRIWRLRTPWGWGLDDMGFAERHSNRRRRRDRLNDATIEPICRKYAELRYRLIPYTYTLAAEARETGLPMMRAMWLHYPSDERARSLGTQYLWGRDLLVAPVFTKRDDPRSLSARRRLVRLVDRQTARGEQITRAVDLATMPLYVRAGAIIPFDPVRQYTAETVAETTHDPRLHRGQRRLHAVFVAPGLPRPLAVVVLPPAGQRDDRHGPPRLFADAARGVVAVQPRHAHVHQDDVRPNRSAASTASTPSWAVAPRSPIRRSIIASDSAPSRLSSTTRMRRPARGDARPPYVPPGRAGARRERAASR